MKVRNDFVTNSSSSSFIMAFKNDDGTSYEHFKETCHWYDYEEFLKLIKHFKKDKEHTDKEKALEFLYHCYSSNYKLELLDSELHVEDYKTPHDHFIARMNLEQTDEFKAKVKAYVEQNEEYLAKKKQIEEADLIVKGTIWDTNGGLLEWAIRNSFIEDNFRSNHVITWNVG